MVETSPSSISKSWEAIVRRLGWSVAGIGAAVLTGWTFDISWLKSVSPNWIAAKPNTALAFVLAGLALWLESRRSHTPNERRSTPAHLLAAVVVLLGGITLVEAAAGVDLGIDQWLFKEAPGATATVVPGRMALPTMLAFAFLGLSLLLDNRNKLRFLLIQIMASTAMALAFVYLLFYVFGVWPSTGLGSGTPMALPTSLAFLLLGAGILGLRPDWGVIGMLRNKGLKGLLARRLLPAALLLPPIIGSLRIVGERTRAFESDFGVILVVVTYIVLFSLFVGWSAQSLGRQEDKRHGAEARRRESEKMYRLILEQSADAIWLVDLASLRFVYVSPSIERLRGYTVEEALAQSIEEALTPESYAYVLEKLPAMLEDFAAGNPSARVQVHELDLPRKDGRIITTEVVTSILADAQGQAAQVLGVSRDISERKRIHEEKTVSLEFMQLVNASPDIRHLARAAVDFFHEKSGFEAVGIRLKEGQDYPYYETRGFPSEFVRRETSLCSMTEDGRLVRDEHGQPLIECMCGNVIQGRFDAKAPFFTPHGSFWTNSTTGLLATTTEENRKAGPRNRCNGEGYDSVGLFPLRSGDRNFGLLQLNDRRIGRFTPDTIGLWEQLADHLAVAMAKFLVEERLRGSEERYRSLFENMIEGFAYCRMIWDGERPANFVYLAVNKAFEALTGLRDVEGKPVSEVIPGIRESDPGLFEIYGRVVRTGKPERFETFVQAMDKWFAVGVYSPAADHFVAVFDVITTRKQAEAEILRLNTGLEQRVRERTAELQAANKELEAFSYSVSHDLRAPLRGIDGWSQALVEDYSDRLDQRGLGYLQRVRAETQRMGTLIDDMLQLARVTRAELQLETIDLSARALSVAERLREAYPDRTIRFEIRPGLKVRADARLLDIALTNLLDNACKFTGPRAEARIEVGRAEDRGPGVFFVRDNGVGFDTAYAENLFAPFQRMHKASDFPGTGIGLATVKRIIHRHGGRVWADSRPDAGAEFYFTLEEPL